MTAVIISALYSLLIAVIETVGLYIAKRLARKDYIDREAREAVTIALERNRYAGTDKTVNEVNAASEGVKKRLYDQMIVEVVPGPEMCALAVALELALFLAYNYSNDGERLLLSPWLAGTKLHALPILLGLMMLGLAAWFILQLWREKAALTDSRWLHLAGITASGLVMLMFFFLIVLIGRT